MFKLKILIFSICLFGLKTSLSARDVSQILTTNTSKKLSPKLAGKEKKNLVKPVWSMIELDQKINSSLFYPYNGYHQILDRRFGKIDMSFFDDKKMLIHWNLYTIILVNVLQENLVPYLAFDPNFYLKKDNGFLNFPVTMEKYGDTTSKINENDNRYFDLLFSFSLVGNLVRDYYSIPLRSYEFPDEDSIIYKEKDGVWEAVYPPDEQIWYLDEDIIGFKLKEEWTLNSSELTIDKKISAIAPVINL